MGNKISSKKSISKQKSIDQSEEPLDGEIAGNLDYEIDPSIETLESSPKIEIDMQSSRQFSDPEDLEAQKIKDIQVVIIYQKDGRKPIMKVIS
jgi:hypothetical protein